MRADLIVQFEVARKHASTPPTALRTAGWAPWWEFELGPVDPADSFRPQPSVDAAVLTIRKRRPAILPERLAPTFVERLRTDWSDRRGPRCRCTAPIGHDIDRRRAGSTGSRRVGGEFVRGDHAARRRRARRRPLGRRTADRRADRRGRGTIPAWPAVYDDLAGRIRGALGDQVLDLEHVGSTSVPGLAAKPVIDIDLTVADASDEDAYVGPLERSASSCGFGSRSGTSTGV